MTTFPKTQEYQYPIKSNTLEEAIDLMLYARAKLTKKGFETARNDDCAYSEMHNYWFTYQRTNYTFNLKDGTEIYSKNFEKTRDIDTLLNNIDTNNLPKLKKGEIIRTTTTFPRDISTYSKPTYTAIFNILRSTEGFLKNKQEKYTLVCSLIYDSGKMTTGKLKKFDKFCEYVDKSIRDRTSNIEHPDEIEDVESMSDPWKEPVPEDDEEKSPWDKKSKGASS